MRQFQFMSNMVKFARGVGKGVGSVHGLHSPPKMEGSSDKRFMTMNRLGFQKNAMHMQKLYEVDTKILLLFK